MLTDTHRYQFAPVNPLDELLLSRRSIRVALYMCGHRHARTGERRMSPDGFTASEYLWYTAGFEDAQRNLNYCQI